MKYTNIFYVPHFNIIGGIETYCYELAKKYGQYDITVVYKSGYQEQIQTLSRMSRCLHDILCLHHCAKHYKYKPSGEESIKQIKRSG